MAPARRISIAIAASALLSGVRAAHAQTPEDFGIREIRVVATGVYHGTLHGDRSYDTYQGDHVHETMDCALTMQFEPGGVVRYDAGAYVYRKTTTTKTPNGNVVAVTTIRTQGTKDATASSRLSLHLLTGNPALIQSASWQPVYTLGTSTTHITFPTSRGTLYRDPPASENVQVYCQPEILWKGPKNQGPGKPLSGTYDGPDGHAAKAWVNYQPPPKYYFNFHDASTIHVQWNLTPLYQVR
jgi:hypothetical protein